jgi:hypothetical protein
MQWDPLIVTDDVILSLNRVTYGVCGCVHGWPHFEKYYVDGSLGAADRVAVRTVVRQLGRSGQIVPCAVPFAWEVIRWQPREIRGSLLDPLWCDTR